MIADILTKEGLNNQSILDILHENVFKDAGNEDNFVSHTNGDIKLTNNKLKTNEKDDNKDLV